MFVYFVAHWCDCRFVVYLCLRALALFRPGFPFFRVLMLTPIFAEVLTPSPYKHIPGIKNLLSCYNSKYKRSVSFYAHLYFAYVMMPSVGVKEYSFGFQVQLSESFLVLT